jgi:hypothetical protein
MAALLWWRLVLTGVVAELRRWSAMNGMFWCHAHVRLMLDV